MRPTPSILDLLSPRFETASHSNGVIGAERVLAWVRVVLALGSVLQLELNPAEVYPYRLAYRLIVLYLVYAFGLLIAVQLKHSVPARFHVLAHMVDVIWPAVIGLFGGGVSSPFFLYFIFALFGAAFRWGMQENILTTIAVIAGLAADAIARSATPLATIFGDPVLRNFALQSAFVLSFAFLIGYVVEWERRRAQEAWSISRISAMVRIEGGVKASLETVIQEILKLFSGKKLLLITRVADTCQVILWRGERVREENVVFSWRTLEDGEQEPYLSAMGDEVAGAVWHDRTTVSSVAIKRDGSKRREPCYLPSRLVDEHPFHVLIGCAIPVASGISARVLLFDPHLGGRGETQLRFLSDLLKVVTPALYNVYLLRRVRSRAVIAERGRLSRELHDGTVQGLQAIAFRLYALRTRSTVTPADRDRELFEVQQLVQNEAASVRHLIHELAPLDFEPRHLLDFLAAMVVRYRENTGIAAQFISDVSQVDLPPATCREIAGIVREALANVRRHSGAENVLVRLGHELRGWLLVIEDDGRGFEFSGRFSHLEREENRGGPLVIKQRVRAIEGELTIISKAGQGARLEVRIPSLARASIA